jgi:hypothetical protein
MVNHVGVDITAYVGKNKARAREGHEEFFWGVLKNFLKREAI